MRYFYLIVIAAVVSMFVSLSQGCAGGPTAQNFLTKASHFLSKAQDAEQRLAKGYNALCAGREDSEECKAIASLLEDINGAKVDVAADYEALNTDTKEPAQ